jgi:hypothetical protein
MTTYLLTMGVMIALCFCASAGAVTFYEWVRRTRYHAWP